jgi:hypothetical protein
MHIPPGIDPFGSSRGGNCMNAVPLWADTYATQFSVLMQAYSDVVQLGFAGHTHMDDFRVAASGAPSLPLRITPAVSPLFDNNPGFSVLSYDVKTGSTSDITTFFISLASQTPRWTKEYRFSSAYGVRAFDATDLFTVATEIRNGDAARQTFESDYAVSASSPINSSNWPFYSCAQTEVTGATYTNCVCGVMSVHSKQ